MNLSWIWWALSLCCYCLIRCALHGFCLKTLVICFAARRVWPRRPWGLGDGHAYRMEISVLCLRKGTGIPQGRGADLGHPECSGSAGNLEVQDLGCSTPKPPSMPGSHSVPKQSLAHKLAGHWVVGQDFRSPAWAALGWGTSIHQAALSFHTSFSLSGFPSASVYLIGYNKLLTTLCRLSSPILSNTLSSAPNCTPSLQEPTYQQGGLSIVLQADQGL